MVEDGILKGLDASPAGLAVWNADQRLIFANRTMRRNVVFSMPPGMTFQAFAEAIAASREWMLPMPPDEWVEDQAAGFAMDRQDDYTLASGRAVEWVQSLTDDGGMVLTLSDRTAIKRNETALRKMKEDAEATDEAKSRFLRAANHDLRQPLASLKILIYNCLREADHEHRNDILHAMDVAADVMEDLLGALLQIGQLDAGRIQARISTFQLHQLFERLEIQFRHQAAEKGLRLRFVHTRHAVTTDRALLERILSNFVANAIRFTGVGGILVGCRPHGAMLRIDVIDTGQGVRPEEQDRIFEEFYRSATNPQGRKSGLGLGLNIVKRLAMLLGHPIGLRSVMGHGSAFSITVPIGNIWHSEAPEPDISEAIAGEFVGVPMLVVEDDDILRDSMSRLLERWGVIVHTAADGKAASALIAEGLRPQLIIADYNVKTSTGLDVIAELREAAGSGIPAFLVTADADPRVLEAAREADVPLLIKPVSPPRLRVMMHNMLFEPKPAPGGP